MASGSATFTFLRISACSARMVIFRCHAHDPSLLHLVLFFAVLPVIAHGQSRYFLVRKAAYTVEAVLLGRSAAAREVETKTLR